MECLQKTLYGIRIERRRQKKKGAMECLQTLVTASEWKGKAGGAGKAINYFMSKMCKFPCCDPPHAQTNQQTENSQTLGKGTTRHPGLA